MFQIIMSSMSHNKTIKGLKWKPKISKFCNKTKESMDIRNKILEYKIQIQHIRYASVHPHSNLNYFSMFWI